MTIKFAAVGAAHPHVHNQISALLAAGARFEWFYDQDPAARAEIVERYPGVQLARKLQEILDDESVQLIVGTPIPDQRAALGIQAMQHAKDYLCAKPGFTTLDQLHQARDVQRETGRIYSVYFGERFGSVATVRAGELVHSGAIGRVIQTIGLGPHRLLGHTPRPDWAFDVTRFGGILNDLASHQIDQFLYFTGSTDAEIVHSQVGNARFHEFSGFEDFGDLLLRSNHATGYVRVDWLTPKGLPTWGDVRLFLLGTTGTIEIRKNIDVAGREGKDHLFLADEQGARHIPCSDGHLPFASQLIADILHRTETTMPQTHCFLACELALKAQAAAAQLRFP